MVAPSLTDRHNRVIDYLRVSITDLCNLKCVYCRPPEGVSLVTHEDILRYEEILTIVRVARDLGIRKIRVTGGEPLVRRDVLGFLSALNRIEGIEDVGLTTNGILLAPMAKALRDTGLSRINVSLDSLRKEVFRSITRGDHLQQVLEGIRAILAEGFHPVKINVVLLSGINEADVPEFARLTRELPVDVRFIERMPFSTEPVANPPDSFSARKALEMIRAAEGELIPEERNSLDGPATMFRLPGAKGRVGVIDPMTGHFCGTCNRLRLTARGTLRPCLLRSLETDIKGPLRKGAGKEELARIIESAVLCKPPAGRSLATNESIEGMYTIGG
jgi:GTP 3',8-cyclase